MFNQEKFLLNFIKAGIYLVLILVPLLLWSALIFPYITTKTLLFRGVVDLILPFYLYLIYKYPKWRPAKSPLFFAFLSFVVISFFTSILGINFLKSFFGDLERMWGVFTLIHFVLFFLILISIFKEDKDWQKLFKTTLWVATAVALYGLAQHWGLSIIIRAGVARIETTLGNAAFVAGYFLLTISLAIFLIFREFYDKRKINYFYLMSLFIQLLAFYYAGIRGGYLALVIALIIALIALIFYQQNKKWKLAFILILLIFAAGYSFLYFNRTKPWVTDNTYLARLTSITSLSANSVRTRFISWRAGLTGFQQTPILGIGMENYNYYFDKYLDPVFYNFSRTETWFDRAHDALVEVLVASGIIGLLSYLLIFVILLYYLLKILKRDREKNFYLVLIFFLLILTYFIQNIFVFDTLVVFMIFLLAMAYLNFLYQQGKVIPENQPAPKVLLDNKSFAYSLIIITIIFSLFSIIININILRIAFFNARFQYEVIKSKDHQSGLIDEKKVFSIDSYLDYLNNKSATLMIDSLVNNFNDSKNDQNLIDSLTMALNKLEKDVARYPAETFSLVVLGRTYNIMANSAANEQSKNEDIIKAYEYLEKAKTLSPGRLQVYYLLAQNKMIVNDFTAAKNYLDEAIKLNPEFSDSYWFAGINFLNFDHNSEGLNYINLALDKGYTLTAVDQALNIITIGIDEKDYQTVARLYEIIINFEPNNAQHYVNLAITYALMGEKDKAIATAEKAAEINPDYLSEAENFVKQVRDGTFKLNSGE